MPSHSYLFVFCSVGFEDRAKEINYMKAVFSFSPQKQLELTTTTSEVYTTQLTLRVDDTKDMAGLDNYLRVIRQSRKRVGVGMFIALLVCIKVMKRSHILE